MLNVLPIPTILTIIAVVTAGASTGVYYIAQYFGIDWPPYRIATSASFIAWIVITIMLSNVGFSKIWGLICWFTPGTYPNLTGTWSGKILYANDDGEREIPIRAVIRQSFLVIQIDVHAENSKTITLSAMAGTVQGQHFLYYLYRSEPRNPDWHPFDGTAELRIRVSTGKPKPPVVLSGTYHTARKTIGRIELVQVGTDPNVDISYY